MNEPPTAPAYRRGASPEVLRRSSSSPLPARSAALAALAAATVYELAAGTPQGIGRKNSGSGRVF